MIATSTLDRPAVATDPLAAGIAAEAARRRTFAIISHPDAGKTTLTEKLLLYGGAVALAGSVTARKTQRHAASDWMAMERERGISISSTTLAFPYAGCQINLLDTPGHQDFSEDTYRTLTAVDSAVMVLDAARGIEPQTLKLFGVCRQRRTPIFTFVNKLDRPGRHPLDLLDEIERVLGLRTYPLNWPIGDGPDFRGVYDRETGSVHLFERTEHGAKRAPVRVASLDDPALDALIGAQPAATLREDLELLDAAGTPFDQEAVLAGELTPVCFGSALTNFGVQLFLDRFVALAPTPGAQATSETVVEPADPAFSGFVFKIQANMDPRHRDRVAFLRVVSGRFERDMEVWHPRSKKRVRLARPLRLFGQDREVVEEDYAGDVVGLINPGLFAIGDTVSEAEIGEFPPLPRFQPEHFALLRHTQADRYKQFLKGLTQIEEEGAIQLFYPVSSGRREPILAAVGALQFDVVRYRLEAEYNVATHLEPLAYSAARWVTGDPLAVAAAGDGRGRLRAEDRDGRPVILFTTAWDLRFAEENAAGVRFAALAAATDVSG
ncbi:MAG: Peptide chain release factor 3 [uncultured Thermomicrobiales bacterium]|uniref:Peptide chain release factor 3 n=1 Tax=uncultured Thermomicrobiales bacterium TaxID=1645740 RepID=A0A6J4TYK5_9BACT|nr:MAG: Peptide chain release factor 3 [uncultured Thermomicrobiales bacterium]